MQNNYHFLKHLTKSLDAKLRGMELAECFTQNKDELILGFCKPDDEFWIRALLEPGFTSLSFPDEFKRSKRNNTDIFKSLEGKKISKVMQFENERAFAVLFTDRQSLVFKMFGRNANLVLFKSDDPEELFLGRYENDKELRMASMHRPIDQSREAFEAGGLKAVFPTFGKDIAEELVKRGFDATEGDERWEILQKLLAYLENPRFYVGQQADGMYKLSLFPLGNSVLDTQDPLEAANVYFRNQSRVYYLENERKSLTKQLDKTIKRTEAYIQNCEEKLHSLLNGLKYEETANIIMANLHQIPKRSEKVVLFDFYRNEEVEIAMKPTLSPQKNAEQLYRKGKNQKIEIQNLEQNIEERRGGLEEAQRQMSEALAAESLRDLRSLMKQEGLGEKEAQKQAFPFRRFLVEGFEIWIGKSSENNDLLTLKYAQKDDLWLHAKDVSGSHVVIKRKAGSEFPKNVLERAAELAAYYSKRKTDTLCPVLYTPKKYVRKRKGDPAGLVVVEREKVIMVQPRAWEA